MNIYKKVFKRTLSAFDITEEEMLSTCRKPHFVRAKEAYILTIHIIGQDIYEANRQIIKRKHTMPSYYLIKAIDRFKESEDFRDKIKIINKDNDKYKQYASTHPLKTADSTEDVVEEGKRERNDYPRSEYGKILHSFDFSDREETEIANACDEARAFFKKYGRGYKAQGVLMVDKSNYYQDSNQESPKERVKRLINKIKQIQLLKQIKTKKQNEPTTTLSAPNA